MSSPRLPTSRPRSKLPSEIAAARRYEARHGVDAFGEGIGAFAVAARLAHGTYLQTAVQAFQQARPRTSAEVPEFEPLPPEMVFVARHYLRQHEDDALLSVHVALVRAGYAPADTFFYTALARSRDLAFLQDFLPRAILEDMLTNPPLRAHREMLGIALDAERMAPGKRLVALEARLRALASNEAQPLGTVLHGCRTLLHLFRTPIRRRRGHPPNVPDRIFAQLIAANFEESGRGRPTRADLANLHGTFVPEPSSERAKQRWRDRLRAIDAPPSTCEEST